MNNYHRNATSAGHTCSTVIDLIGNDRVEHIDLTNLDDSPPTSPRRHGVREPPRKRQRVGDGGSALRPKSRDVTTCLKAQVKPYIDVPLANVHVDKASLDDVSYRGHVVKDIYDITLFSLEHHFNTPLAHSPTTTASQRASSFSAFSAPTLAPVQRSSQTSKPATARVNVTPTKALTLSKASPTKPSQTAPIPSVSASATNYRTQARARSFKSWKLASQAAPATARQKAKAAWMNMARRPYLTSEERQSIFRGTSKLVQTRSEAASLPSFPFHVDFTPDELEIVRNKVWEMSCKKAKAKRSSDMARETRKLLKKRPDLLTILSSDLALKGGLAQRDETAIRNLVDELMDRYKRPAKQPKVLTLEVDEFDKHSEGQRSSQIPSLLFAREIDGNRGFGRMRRHVNFTNEFRKSHEDDLEMRAEWVGCAGDIMTIAWTSEDNFVCGATAHSDSHNQQYNKEGNLLLCSTKLGRLKAYADHRIIRPVVEKGENSTEAMRESRSPWLYSSVVSSDYDQTNDRAYTSSFDKTVKVWKVDAKGENMVVLGTWPHTGNVNFVAASKHESGMVATAADVPNQAVRIYQVNSENVSQSPFQAYSGSRAWNEDDEQTTVAQKWAYFPATMQWGIAKDVQHLLLVGYSPRSFTGDDNDIPDDKKSTGEICVWNCLTNEKMKVTTASTQNVFEVRWHPNRPSFIVATSPAGLNVDDKTRTQIRIFHLSNTPEGEGAFSEIQCLDCPAKDINELTIKPNSFFYSYITAACTDGKVYVWDTARGDKPVHALRHKKPIDAFAGDREEADVGVKFTSWGTTADRFYTGGSDGVVKVWDVRNLGKPLVRDLLEAPGAICCGAFSPGFTKLAIGDATGRVMLLSLNKEDEPIAKFVQPRLPTGLGSRSSRPVRRPIPITEHAEPPAPNADEEPQTGAGRGRRFLASGQLIRHRDPTVGVLQGPAYSDLGLYRREVHFEGDPTRPLLAKVEERQQENRKMFPSSLKIRRLQTAVDLDSSDLQAWHARNLERDLNLQSLDETTRLDLLMDQVCIDDPIYDQGWDFAYEETDYDKGAWAWAAQ
ncbi:Rik1-associated factor 1 [Colletotrichum chlorophyti]|uniref:Rik1-associated factor 1 n=1 Tax=Colletotrichum chlorophyti TaxID=708187 RepID=A0A1Q8RPQ1_9PEZI|nr:Rik1-associated factor 1 [Colletotrichum chlorophyti]